MIKVTLKNFIKEINKELSLNIPSISFSSGKLNVIQGANGTGKTTFLLILLGADSNYKGEIKYFCNGNEKSVKSDDIIYVPPKNALIKYLSIKSNLNIFNKVDINKFNNEFKINLDTKVINLSGGEEEIISIYRLKNLTNKVLLLDEVTSFLDDSMFDRIIEIILHLAKVNLVIFATHDTRVLSRYKPNFVF